MNDYEDMLFLPHPVSKNHLQMSLRERAAQFSPFAALTGYEEVIQETARLTQKKHILDENKLEEMERLFTRLLEMPSEKREQERIQVVHFQKDPKKDGGYYKSTSGYLKKADFIEKKLLLSEGDWIYFEDIYEAE